MRTITAALTTAQKKLTGKPAWSLVVGAATLTPYLIAYDYAEALDRTQPITLTLNNATGHFNANAPAQGAICTLQRGIGADYAELPRFWVEGVRYNYAGRRALCIVKCIDWWGLLDRANPVEEFTDTTTATAWLEYALSMVGLTRLTGAMTALNLTLTRRATESLATFLRRLSQKMPERLYAGLDGEIKWKTIPTNEASVYTFGWNDASHRVMRVEGGTAAWARNSILVMSPDSTYQGTATDAAQIALVGTRHIEYRDAAMTSDAMCLTAATSYLNQYAAQATQAAITCRPCHGLELLDVVKMDNPPWGGSDITGRVVAYREIRSGGAWQQTITLGAK